MTTPHTLGQLHVLMRDTAEQIQSDQIQCRSSYAVFGDVCAARVWRAAAVLVEQCLERQWRWDLPAGDGWYWCEELEADAPPQQVRLRGNGAVERWTVGGWVRVTGRVCRVSDRPCDA